MTISARFAAIFTAAALTLGVGVGPANAQVTAFKQAIAESASVNDELSEFYRTNNYAPLWTGEGDVFAARRAALARHNR